MGASIRDLMNSFPGYSASGDPHRVPEYQTPSYKSAANYRRNSRPQYSNKAVPLHGYEIADTMKSLAEAMARTSGKEIFDPEYEDYQWRLKRAEAYARNPAAFRENSKFGRY